MYANLNLAIYCRVSSDEQKTGGNIHRQIEQAPVEIQRLGLLRDPSSKLIPRLPSADVKEQYFVDEAYNLEEIREGTAFFELLSLCRSGEINAIYVDSIDRIFRARSHTVRGQIMDLLENHDIQVYTPSGLLTEGLVRQIMSAIGAEDKTQTLRKLHLGKKTKVQNNGRPPNGRAFWGFHFDKTANQWLIIEEEANVVRWAAAMSAGKVLDGMPSSLKLMVEDNPTGVSDKLIIEGFDVIGVNLLNYFKRNNFRDALRKNPTGKLPRNWLSNIYRDNRYTGQHIYRLKPVTHIGRKQSSESEREAIIVNIPVIVPPEDWELAKAARQHRACVTPRHAKQEYLLQGVIYCAECGGRMSARARHHDYYKRSTKSVVKNIAKYYVCQSKPSENTMPCSHKKCHPSDRVDSYVWERVVQYFKNDVFVRIQNKTKSTKHIEDEIKSLNVDVKDLEAKEKEVEIEKGRFLTLIGKGLLSESDWVSQKHRLEKELKEIGLQKVKLQRTIKINQKKVVELKEDKGASELINKYANKLDTLSFEERKTICDILIHKILLKPDNSIELFLKG